MESKAEHGYYLYEQSFTEQDHSKPWRMFVKGKWRDQHFSFDAGNNVKLEWRAYVQALLDCGVSIEMPLPIPEEYELVPETCTDLIPAAEFGGNGIAKVRVWINEPIHNWADYIYGGGITYAESWEKSSKQYIRLKEKAFLASDWGGNREPGSGPPTVEEMRTTDVRVQEFKASPSEPIVPAKRVRKCYFACTTGYDGIPVGVFDGHHGLTAEYISPREDGMSFQGARGCVGQTEILTLYIQELLERLRRAFKEEKKSALDH